MWAGIGGRRVTGAHPGGAGFAPRPGRKPLGQMAGTERRRGAQAQGIGAGRRAQAQLLRRGRALGSRAVRPASSGLPHLTWTGGWAVPALFGL